MRLPVQTAALTAPLQQFRIYGRWKGEERLIDIPFSGFPIDWNELEGKAACWITQHDPWRFLEK